MLGRMANPTEVWTATVAIDARPDDVLRALTDPDAIAGWAPVDFELEGRAGRRLRTGSRERVSGSVAGVRASFAVEVLRADEHQLELIAEGPLAFHVAYRFTERGRGVLVDASVKMRRGGGLSANLLRAAAGALLNAGALSCALRRLQAAINCETDAPVLVAV